MDGPPCRNAVGRQSQRRSVDHATSRDRRQGDPHEGAEVVARALRTDFERRVGALVRRRAVLIDPRVGVGENGHGGAAVDAGHGDDGPCIAGRRGIDVAGDVDGSDPELVLAEGETHEAGRARARHERCVVERALVSRHGRFARRCEREAGVVDGARIAGLVEDRRVRRRHDRATARRFRSRRRRCTGRPGSAPHGCRHRRSCRSAPRCPWPRCRSRCSSPAAAPRPRCRSRSSCSRWPCCRGGGCRYRSPGSSPPTMPSAPLRSARLPTTALRAEPPSTAMAVPEESLVSFASIRLSLES